MLAYKFHNSTTARIINDTSKLFPCLPYLKFIGKRLTSNESNKSKCNIKYQSKQSDKYKKNVDFLLRSPNKFLFHFNYRKLNSSDKCDIKTIVSDYEEAHKRVKKHIECIHNFIKKEKRTIIESLKKETSVDKTNVSRWVKNISKCVDERLQQLIQLDPCFASETRITVLRFKNRANNTFVALYHELMPSVRQIVTILEKLQTETTRSTDKAIALALFPLNDDTSSTLKKCFLKNTEEAENILERTMKEVEMKLNEVKKLRNNVLKFHKEAINEAINEHSSEMQALAQCLDDCISSLKKLDK